MATPERRVDDSQALVKVLNEAMPDLKRLAPKYVNLSRLMALALEARMRNPLLEKCSITSVLNFCKKAAEWGTDRVGAGGVWPVPFWNKKTNSYDMTPIPDWRLLVEKAKKAKAILHATADIVREGDVFAYSRGLSPDLQHQPALGGTGEVIAAYCIYTLPDGTRDFVVMASAEIGKVRNSSKAKSEGPWVDWPEEMAKKGLALDTPIPTPTGWTTMGDIKEGQYVFDLYGQVVRVTAASEVKSLPCYRITFASGESIVCDHEHRWLASIGRNGSRSRIRQGWKVYTINELFQAKAAGQIISMPICYPLNTSAMASPIDPWLFGYWLGNGDSKGAGITVHLDDLEEICRKIQASRYRLGKIRRDRRAKACHVGITDGFLDDLRDLDLLHNKHIPNEHMRASESQRMALLQGLMDSDGHVDKRRGRAIFGNTNKRLAHSVAELVFSLGEVCHVRTSQATGFGKTVELHTVTWQPERCPVTTYRKARNYRPRRINLYRGVSSIKTTASVPTRCIAVESDSKTYLAGSMMVPTHNTVVKRTMKLFEGASVELTALLADDNAVLGLDLTPPEPIAMPRAIEAASEEATGETKGSEEAEEKKEEEKKPEAEASKGQGEKPSLPVISEAQAKRLYAIAKSAHRTDDNIKQCLTMWGYEHARDVKKADYEAICKSLESVQAREPGED